MAAALAYIIVSRKLRDRQTQDKTENKGQPEATIEPQDDQSPDLLLDSTRAALVTDKESDESEKQELQEKITMLESELKISRLQEVQITGSMKSALEEAKQEIVTLKSEAKA